MQAQNFQKSLRFGKTLKWYFSYDFVWGSLIVP